MQKKPNKIRQDNTWRGLETQRKFIAIWNDLENQAEKIARAMEENNCFSYVELTTEASNAGMVDIFLNTDFISGRTIKEVMKLKINDFLISKEGKVIRIRCIIQSNMCELKRGDAK